MRRRLVANPLPVIRCRTSTYYDTDLLIEVLGELRRLLGGEKATPLWDGPPAHRSKATQVVAVSRRTGWWSSGCPRTLRS